MWKVGGSKQENSAFPLSRVDFYFDKILLKLTGSKINLSEDMSTVGAAMIPSDLKSLVRRFYALQTERMEAYKLFEEGHEAYLRTGPHYDFEHYRQLVDEITKAFSGISKEVLEIKARLHQDFDRPDLSEHIEKLQLKEKQKLELNLLQRGRERRHQLKRTQMQQDSSAGDGDICDESSPRFN